MSGLLARLHTGLVFQRRVAALAAGLSNKIPPGAQVLDVGCGDGQISSEIMRRTAKVSVTGIDVLLRPVTHIPVVQFDGETIPFPDASFDVVMFVDVLHHTLKPELLLKEAARVSRRHVLLKDHFRRGFLAASTLRLMDWVGNAHHGVVLPYNYLAPAEWNQAYKTARLRTVSVENKIGLYPQPADLVFGRGLHFIALLEKE
ncbi:MAG: class I SAM-dependent methyltransferase [Chthoniobacterales bacterium]